MTRTNRLVVSRGCLFEENVAAGIRGSDTAAIWATIFTCSTGNCNDNYVNNELEILEEKPVFNPSALLPLNQTEIEEICNDENGDIQPEVCMQCFVCETTRTEMDDEEAADYLDCIVGARTKKIFPRFRNGFPVTCAIKVGWSWKK